MITYDTNKTHEEYATEIDRLLPRGEVPRVRRIVSAMPVDNVRMHLLLTRKVIARLFHNDTSVFSTTVIDTR
jgi:hypothetical protein